MSGKKLGLVLLLATIVLLAESIYTIQLTIYPKMAQSKGGSSLEYTLVFAVFDAAIALCSPFIGTLTSLLKSEPKRMLIISLFLEGSCLLLFGNVGLLEGHATFVAASFVLRLVEGAAAASIFVNIFTLVALHFPDDFGIIFLGILESLVPAGFVLGPLIGSILQNFGGFSAPFLFVGGLFFSLAAAATTLVPAKGSEVNAEAEEAKLCDEPETKLSFDKHSDILANFICISVSSTVVTFYFALLEPYLRGQFETSSYLVGTVFAVAGFLYSVFSLFASIISTRIGEDSAFYDHVILLGLLAQLGGNCVIIIARSFTAAFFGIGLLSLGSGLTIFLAFLQAQDKLRKIGFSPEKACSIASGSYMSCLTCGSMSGPLIGGALVDFYGFQRASCFTVLLIWGLLFWKCSANFKPRKERGNYSLVTTKEIGFDLDNCSV